MSLISYMVAGCKYGSRQEGNNLYCYSYSFFEKNLQVRLAVLRETLCLRLTVEAYIIHIYPFLKFCKVSVSWP